MAEPFGLFPFSSAANTVAKPSQSFRTPPGLLEKTVKRGRRPRGSRTWKRPSHTCVATLSSRGGADRGLAPGPGCPATLGLPQTVLPGSRGPAPLLVAGLTTASHNSLPDHITGFQLTARCSCTFAACFINASTEDSALGHRGPPAGTQWKHLPQALGVPRAETWAGRTQAQHVTDNTSVYQATRT